MTEEINYIISEYVQIEQMVERISLSRQFNISGIDFILLRWESARAKKRNLILKDLQNLICERLNRMLLNNPNHIKFHERYQSLRTTTAKQDCANIEKGF